MGKSRLIRATFLVAVAALCGLPAEPETTWRPLLDNPAAVELPLEKSLADLSSAEADFRG